MKREPFTFKCGSDTTCIYSFSSNLIKYFKGLGFKTLGESKEPRTSSHITHKQRKNFTSFLEMDSRSRW
jgi:hypothetical protein